MSFISRLGKGFMDVFGGYAVLESRGGGSLSSLLPSRGSTYVPRTISEVLKFYEKSPLLRMVGGRISSDCAAQGWHVYAPTSNKQSDLRYARRVKNLPRHTRQAEIGDAIKQGDLRRIDGHPILTLLHEGNEFMLGWVQRKLTQLHLDLVGEAFWLLSRNVVGAPITAYILPPSWVIKTPEDGQNFFTVKYGNKEIEVPREEVIWFIDPNPSQPYGRGLGTGTTLADELEIEEYAAKHVKTFFQNRARPDVLIAGPNLQRDAAARVEARWLEKLQGFRRAYLPFFMEAPDGMQLHTLSQDFESMQLLEVRKHERDIVMQTFGVSPEIFGVVENSNRATIDAADFLIAKHVTTPRLDLQREYLQKRLMPLYGDSSLIVEYDSPIDEDREFALKAAKAAPHTRTVNEWRDIQNLEHINGGDVYVAQSNLAAFEMPSDIKPQQQLAAQETDEESEQNQIESESDSESGSAKFLVS